MRGEHDWNRTITYIFVDIYYSLLNNHSGGSTMIEPLEECIVKNLCNYAKAYKAVKTDESRYIIEQKGLFPYLDEMESKGYDKDQMFSCYMRYRDILTGFKGGFA